MRVGRHLSFLFLGSSGPAGWHRRRAARPVPAYLASLDCGLVIKIDATEADEASMQLTMILVGCTGRDPAPLVALPPVLVC